MINLQRKGWPLAWVVSGVIIVCTLLISLVLVGKSYIHTRNLIIEASSHSAIQLTKTVDSEIIRLIKPLETTLRILSEDPLTVASTLEQRNRRIATMAHALRAYPILNSIYIGYPDGSFYLLRSLPNAQLRSALSAPENASFMVQSIERRTGHNDIRRWQYFTQGLDTLNSVDMPDYSYDPRVRPWFISAKENPGDTILTPPYVFHTTQDPGVTMAIQDPESQAIIGLDASVNDLSIFLQKLQLTPGSELAIVNKEGLLLAHPDPKQLTQPDADGNLRLVNLSEMSNPVLDSFFRLNSEPEKTELLEMPDDAWYAIWIPLLSDRGNGLQLLVAFPSSELLEDARASLVDDLLWSGVLIILLVLISLAMGYRIFSPFQQLSTDIAGFAAFDFRKPVESKSYIREINELSSLLSRMASTILHFQQISQSLAYEKDLDKMLQDVTHHLAASSHAVNSLIYLYEPDENILELATLWGTDEDIPNQLACPDSSVATQEHSVRAILDDGEHNVILMPLLNREGVGLGILALELPNDTPADQLPNEYFIMQLSGAAAAAIETRRQVESQRKIIDGMIQLLAGAIDAKSPYTSGHCDRVPQLAEMLIDELQTTEGVPFADFRLNDRQREEFKIAAWLHDCGKVTSPEYVVDKATKLETIYNRIHEIRTRFEVLWRDADIRYLQGLLAQEEESTLTANREKERKTLQDDFNTVARANIGGEFLSDEVITKLEQVSQHTWQRHFSKRLGLSRDELDRMPETVDDSLPAEEKVLDNQQWHLIPWGERKPPVEANDPANIWGFDMKLPEHSFNQGELHNLMIRRGTLTDEERFKVNDHIVQTIIMLSALPLPPALRRVPDIAGNHHERMDGTGYPRKLLAASLSVEERVMAIADIFEALTAADRPYKNAKSLGESLKIMALMAKDQHIDSELFEVFIKSGIYQRYAERFLTPDQRDEIDEAAILALAGFD